MSCTEGQQHREAVTQRGRLALGSVLPKLQQDKSSPAQGTHCHSQLCLAQGWQGEHPRARITSLVLRNWDSRCTGGQEPGWEQGRGPSSPHPPHPEEHSFRAALLRIPVVDPRGLHNQEFTAIQHCPGAWTLLSLLHPMALLPHTLKPSSLPQSTPPAPLFIQDALWEGLISAVS